MSLIDLRFGRWQDVLADVERADSLLTDPPYSPRTADGYRSHGMVAKGRTIGIAYGSITEADAHELALSWSERIERWALIFGDHISQRWHEDSWKSCGWFTFHPIPYIREGAPPRFRGDGPASQSDWAQICGREDVVADEADRISVARRKGLKPDGSRPGWYRGTTVRAGHGYLGITGQKDLATMRRIVRDYSRKGDLVIDPFCGSATTAIACAIEGRRCITAECDEHNYEIARKRIAAGYTPDMFSAEQMG